MKKLLKIGIPVLLLAFVLSLVIPSCRKMIWERGEASVTVEDGQTTIEDGVSDGVSTQETVTETEIEAQPTQDTQTNDTPTFYGKFTWIPTGLVEQNAFRYDTFVACGPNFWDSAIQLQNLTNGDITIVQGVAAQQFLHRLYGMGPANPCPLGQG